MQLRNGKSYRRDSNGYPHIFHHAQFTKVTGDIVRQLLLPYIDVADTKPEVVCNSGTGRATDAIPTATPTFSTTPNTTKSLAISSNNSFYFISTSRSSYNRELCGYLKVRRVHTTLAELHVGRCYIEYGVHRNLYFDAKIAFLSRTDA